MRNPWGNSDEWKGKYGDNDSNWTPELREKYNNVESKGDGRFFMPYSQFTEYFNCCSICYYKDDYILSSFNEVVESHIRNCYSFQITQEGEYFVSLSQTDSHGQENLANPYSKKTKIFFNFYLEFSFSRLSFILCEFADGQIKCLGGKESQARDIWIKAKLKPGFYYIFVSDHWLTPKGQDELVIRKNQP